MEDNKMVKIFSPEREVLQNDFANRFKKDLEREEFKKSWKYGAMDMAVGIIIMIIMGLIIFLPALLEKSDEIHP